MKSDSQLQADVLEELRNDQRIVSSELGVAARDGVVTVFGEVDNLVKRSAALEDAARVGGVRALANQIHVRLPLAQLRSDADIAHDAVHALMWDTEVPDKSVHVRVQDRWLWLFGEAESQHQRAAAERAIENVRGVKGITNCIRLRSLPAPPDLRDQIRASLARNTQLAARAISVRVQNGSVLLEGAVESWGERMAAEHCAWSRRGVTDVDNRLLVAPR
jgi:osmotically-inducible protein OsmY